MPPTIRSKERTDQILEFLWKWKVATSSGIALSLWGDARKESAYCKLHSLQRKGLIRCAADGSGFHKYWTLTKKGYADISHKYPALQEQGFGSEAPSHDLLVTALQLGLVLNSPVDVEYFTETELRRVHPEVRPAWVPDSALHLPDGYLKLHGSEDLVIGLEAELTGKDSARYQSITQFYASHSAISAAIWVIQKPSLAVRILNAAAETFDGPGTHHFILLRDYLMLGWHAPLVAGPNRGNTLAQALFSLHSPNVLQGESVPFIDTRKKPRKTAVSPIPAIDAYCAWVGKYPNFSRRPQTKGPKHG